MEVSGRRNAGSEETFNVCDMCKDRRSVTRAAYGYCIECRCYLCEDCYHVHKDPPPCRNHRLLEGKQTPKERLPPVDMCRTHPSEKINYFCNQHSSLACQKCAFLKHRTCKNVCDITEIVSAPNIDHTYKELKKNIANLESRSKENRQTHIQNLSKTASNKKQAKADIKQFCAAMHERLYTLEAKVDEEVDKLYEANNTRMDTIQQECDSVDSDLKIVTTMLEISQGPNQKVLSFIAIEKAKAITETLDERLATLSVDNAVAEYKFKPNDQLICKIKDADNVGKLHVATKLPMQKLKVKVEPSLDMDTVTAEEEDGINVRTETDKNTCRITGSTMMEGDTILALADECNGSIKLVDVKQKKVISQLELPDWPWDITQVKHDQLAVTLSDTHKIQFLSVTTGTSLSLGRQMDVSGWCHGIAYNDDRLFISYADSKEVQILDMSGNVLNTISSQTNGQIEFTFPLYLTLSEDRSLLYVTDRESNTLYCLDMNGALKARYKDQELNAPFGVCTAEDGIVIMCGGYSDNLYVISSDCRRGRILLDKSRDVEYPYSVTYSSAMSTLYVGQLESDTLRVFKLK